MSGAKSERNGKDKSGYLKGDQQPTLYVLKKRFCNIIKWAYTKSGIKPHLNASQMPVRAFKMPVNSRNEVKKWRFTML